MGIKRIDNLYAKIFRLELTYIPKVFDLDNLSFVDSILTKKAVQHKLDTKKMFVLPIDCGEIQ
jgi:hypothetical protein